MFVPRDNMGSLANNRTFYSGKRLSEIQTKLCLAWFIARDTVPHTTAHRYILQQLKSVNSGQK